MHCICLFSQILINKFDELVSCVQFHQQIKVHARNSYTLSHFKIDVHIIACISGFEQQQTKIWNMFSIFFNVQFNLTSFQQKPDKFDYINFLDENILETIFSTLNIMVSV